MSEQPDHEPKKDSPDPEEPGWLRPPRIESSADFIVIIFALTVAAILFVLTVGTIFAGAFGEDDIKPYFTIIAGIVSSLISALVGYLAGKGQGRRDAEKDSQG